MQDTKFSIQDDTLVNNQETEKNKKQIRENEYPESEPYRAYTEKTNEKQKLHSYIEELFKKGNFPIKKNDGQGKILDIGSGNGVNSTFLAKLFDKSIIKGIEPSKAQYNLALSKSTHNNIDFENIGLQDYQRSESYDFVLVSHVLQYIQSNIELKSFIQKAIENVAAGGEIWFVQQTKEGINQIIQHQKKFLTNSRFDNWKTADDYEPIIQEIAKEEGCVVEEVILDSSFENIDFKNPTENDKQRLAFILLLEKPFDEQSEEFKKHLALLDLNKNGRIEHPNKIFKIKKI